MKVLFAPDSFKGSLSAPDAARAMRDGWRRVFPNDECVLLPVADGGEGTLDALLADGGTVFTQTVTGPLGTPISARWGILSDGKTAVVELAEAAGLTLVPLEKRAPKFTTTHGVGELLLSALRHNDVTRVVVGLGGSATNDGGAGLLQALGVQLLDTNGTALPPGGAALSRLARVDTSALPFAPAHVQMRIACDVDNPLCGPRGASAIFGPQKGATVDDIAVLDAALTHFASVLGPEIADTPGAGAAGGSAFALLWLFSRAELVPGIDLVLNSSGFDTHLESAGLVLTGEGRLDGQTLGGKAVAGVAKRAQAAQVPVIALAGAIGSEIDTDILSQLGIHAALPIVPAPCTLDQAFSTAATNLSNTAERAARLILLGKG